ncbi:hypothetical protein CSV71_14300 [Sporosarcina sp. P21c]|uniref:hypothetical protein n=1 Tax=Sporosarcina sp. P21c TaxID=2048255 RepID=UPI000C16B700|nr:hypothetical protein [Sporosarcina sp. P21c]PIC88556.1 hypothetical protein CSV71_14300 [Sporosarcina sp. P21c]
MNMYKRDLLEEFSEKDARIRQLYEIITSHKNHKREIVIFDTTRKKGSIDYKRSKVEIEFNVNLGEESILILAHELMHYILVLQGALLPVVMRKEEGSLDSAESISSILSQSITHHFLLKRRLDEIGFTDLHKKFALLNEIQEVPSQYYHGEKIWLLNLYDKSTFANNYNYDDLRLKFIEENMLDVYELLRNSPKENISDINRISQSLIDLFEVGEFLELKELDEYTSI